MVGQSLGLLQGSGLGHPVGSCQSNVEIPNHDTRANNAGAEEDGDVDLVGQFAPGG